jgi:hypothetical protein
MSFVTRPVAAAVAAAGAGVANRPLNENRLRILEFSACLIWACFISVETTVPKVWKTANAFEKTFGTFHSSTHLKHTRLI